MFKEILTLKTTPARFFVELKVSIWSTGTSCFICLKFMPSWIHKKRKESHFKSEEKGRQLAQATPSCLAMQTCAFFHLQKFNYSKYNGHFNINTIIISTNVSLITYMKAARKLGQHFHWKEQHCLPTFRPHARTADSVGLPLTTGSFPSYKS